MANSSRNCQICPCVSWQTVFNSAKVGGGGGGRFSLNPKTEAMGRGGNPPLAPEEKQTSAYMLLCIKFNKLKSIELPLFPPHIKEARVTYRPDPNKLELLHQFTS